MKIELNASCKYTVDIELDEVPEEIVEQLENASGTIDRDSDLADWLNDTLRESDALDWEFEVVDVTRK
jgi:hypothetical protein